MQLLTEKALIIDYGSTHIKGALMEYGPGGKRLLRLESLPIVSLRGESLEGGEAAEELGEYEYNLIRYVQSFFPEELNFVLNLPLERLYVRDVSVPTVNQKQLAEVIPFEVENLLPVSLEEAEVVGQAWEIKEENSSVITFTARHDTLESAVQPLIRGNASLRMLSLDAAGLAGFLNLLGPDETRERTVAQIDIGGRYTIFNAVRDGRLVYTRSIPIGGADVTALVAEHLEVDLTQAEEKKKQLELNLLYDEKRAEKADAFFRSRRLEKKQYAKLHSGLRELFQELAAEIERSIMSLPAPEPAVLYVSGGGSLIGGVVEFLEQETERKFRTYPVALSTGDDPALWATTLGTAEHYRLKSQDRFDFLSGPFGSTLRGGRFRASVFATPILLIAVASIFFLIALLLNILQDRGAKNEYMGQLVRVAKQIPGMPNLPANSKPENYLAAARKICQNRLGAVRGKSGSQRALDIFKTLSETTPTDVDFRISSIQYDGKTAEIVAEMLNVGQAARLEEEYKKNRVFSEVKVSYNMLPNQRVRITIRLTLNRANQAQAGSCS